MASTESECTFIRAGKKVGKTMRMTLRGMAGALLLAAIGVWAYPPTAASGERKSGVFEDITQHSVLHIPSRADFPLAKRISLGLSKSVMVQFPFELKDVLVSDPDKVDAVVQASNRVFLIAKKLGQTNAFFFDTKGQQILTLEVSVGADLGGLDQLLKRLVPGSNIRTEMAGNAVALSGFVRTPLDGKRANDIACQFVATNKGVGSPATFSSASTSTSTLGTTTSQSQNQSNATYESKTQQQASACGSETKLVINLLTIEGEEQVMLKVTVAEVQRTLLKQFGVNVGALVNSGNFSTTILSENTLPLTSAAGLGTLPIANIASGALQLTRPGSPVAGYANSGADTLFNTGTTHLAGVLRALERDGLVRTLAEPNLTAVSGETAKFLAGGEYPIPVVDSDGKLSVTFKEFGVGLAFTPVVLSEGRISLKIESEVSELTNEGAVVLSSISIPALKKRQAKSTVELPSGGSLAIAGLISDTTRQNIDGFPGLKEVPVIGTLFRSRDFQKSETELVVIVTPYMVRPTARQNLVRADEGFAPASDLKANFLGHLNRVYGKGRELPPGGLKGDYGFIVD
jgi:pilus assembly protein CpaC